MTPNTQTNKVSSLRMTQELVSSLPQQLQAGSEEPTAAEEVRNLQEWKGWTQRSKDFPLISSLQGKNQVLRSLWARRDAEKPVTDVRSQVLFCISVDFFHLHQRAFPHTGAIGLEKVLLVLSREEGLSAGPILIMIIAAH